MEAITLTPLFHFHRLDRHSDISRAIATESSPPYIASSRSQTWNPRFFPTGGIGGGIPENLLFLPTWSPPK